MIFKNWIPWFMWWHDTCYFLIHMTVIWRFESVSNASLEPNHTQISQSCGWPSPSLQHLGIHSLAVFQSFCFCSILPLIHFWDLTIKTDIQDHTHYFSVCSFQQCKAKWKHLLLGDNVRNRFVCLSPNGLILLI